MFTKERELEVERLVKQEREQYELDKKNFYANPRHWSNNKRRRNKLPVLRGNVNKTRLKRFNKPFLSARLFCLIEDIIDEILTDTLINGSSEFFDKFVEIKNINCDIPTPISSNFKIKEEEYDFGKIDYKKYGKYLGE